MEAYSRDMDGGIILPNMPSKENQWTERKVA
jgi:hypothetical protein